MEVRRDKAGGRAKEMPSGRGGWVNSNTPVKAPLSAEEIVARSFGGPGGGGGGAFWTIVRGERRYGPGISSLGSSSLGRECVLRVISRCGSAKNKNRLHAPRPWGKESLTGTQLLMTNVWNFSWRSSFRIIASGPESYSGQSQRALESTSSRLGSHHSDRHNRTM